MSLFGSCSISMILCGGFAEKKGFQSNNCYMCLQDEESAYPILHYSWSSSLWHFLFYNFFFNNGKQAHLRVHISWEHLGKGRRGRGKGEQR